MPAYTMLALDMDGTLLTSEKRITKKTREALRRAEDAGLILVVSTGRAASELEDYRADLFDAVRYGSLLSGGVVRDLARGETLSARMLPAELTRAVVEQGVVEDAMVQMFTTECAIMSKRDVDRMPQIGQGVYQDLALRRGHLVESIPAFAQEHADEICKINLHHVSRESLARTRGVLEKLPLQLAVGESASVEVTPRGVTKALGLELLCRHLGVNVAELVVVGDADNDLEALRTSGLAVAMGNAAPEVLAVADIVVADNDHDGIVELVDRLLA